jgi:hypothetical protein
MDDREYYLDASDSIMNAQPQGGVKLKEGELAKLRVKRGKEFVTLDIKAKYGLKTVKHALRWTGK